MKKPKPSPRSTLTRRGLILLGAQMAAVGGLGWRMRQLQVEEADTFRMLAEENRRNIRLLAPARGLIFDRNGKVLADNKQNYRVIMIREEAGDPADALDRLARLIPLSAERREKALKELHKRPAFVPVAVTDRLSWDEIARVAANAPALPGMFPEVGLSRNYPDGEASAHVVGYVGPVSESDLEDLEDPDPLLQIPDFQIGKTGIEVKRDLDLRGAAGASQIEVNALGRVMRELDRRDGAPGSDLHLTLDTDLQSYALERTAGDSAAVVVIDVETGGLVASASAPSFNPNSFVFGISYSDWNGLLNHPYRPLSNKPMSGAYPPGSTYKMIVSLAAMQAGLLDPEETVYCPGYLQVGNRRFHCWKRGGHGWVNLRKGLAQSCDVYYYEMSRRVGIDAISEMANRLGVGYEHELPVPAITGGLTPTKAWKKRKHDDDWRVGDTLNAGIGQGYVLASPLQLAVMAARIATGRAVEPRLIRAVDGRPAADEPFEDLGLSAYQLDLVREGMRAVVNDKRGTAYRSRIADPEIQMAGKTGTSQVRGITAEDRASGAYKNKDIPWEARDHALFVCFAPFDKPRYAAAVVIEHGGGGSTAAAPVARDVMMRALYGPTPPLAAYPPAERKEVERLRAAEPEPPTEVPTAAPSGEARDRV